MLFRYTFRNPDAEHAIRSSLSVAITAQREAAAARIVRSKTDVFARWMMTSIVMTATAALADDFAAEGAAGASHENHGRYVVAMFLGGTHAHGDNELTLGIEGGINLSDNWSVGAVFESTDRGKQTTLYLLGIGWHPIGPELRIQFAAGRKDPDGKRKTVYRAGLGYELDIGSGWFVKPYLALDFIERAQDEQVFGLYLGRSF